MGWKPRHLCVDVLYAIVPMWSFAVALFRFTANSRPPKDTRRARVRLSTEGDRENWFFSGCVYLLMRVGSGRENFDALWDAAAIFHRPR